MGVEALNLRELIQAASMSWRARGVLAYAITHDAPITVQMIVDHAGSSGRKEGVDAAKAIINELVECGYAAFTVSGQAVYLKGRISDELRAAVYARDGHRCVECGSCKRLSVDHIVPESKGGATTLENLQTMCRPCNSEKGASLPEAKP